jgi:alpha-mannosidase
VGGVPLALGALKPSFDGGGTILRVYEPHGKRGPIRLRFADSVRSVTRVNLLEEDAEGAEITLSADGQTASTTVRPFEVLTLRIVR